MARVHLQRLASTYIFSQCAGPRGFFSASRMLRSSRQGLYRPTMNWFSNKSTSWICAIPTQSSPVCTSHLEHNQGWSKFYTSRCYTTKMLDENEELSVPSSGMECKNPVKKPLDGVAKFKVVRVNADGSWQHLSLKTSELVGTITFHCSVFLAFREQLTCVLALLDSCVVLTVLELVV